MGKKIRVLLYLTSATVAVFVLMLMVIHARESSVQEMIEKTEPATEVTQEQENEAPVPETEIKIEKPCWRRWW